MDNFLRKLNAKWPSAAQAHIARHLIEFVKASLYISRLALTSSRPRWLSHVSLSVSHRPSLTSSKVQGRQLLTASASPRNANLKSLVNGCVWKHCLVGKRRAVVQWKSSFLWRRQYSTIRQADTGSNSRVQQCLVTFRNTIQSLSVQGIPLFHPSFNLAR